jgi:hypothetical protein
VIQAKQEEELRVRTAKMELDEQAALNRHMSHIEGVSEIAKSHVFHVQEVVAGQNQKLQEEKVKLDEKMNAAAGRRQELLAKSVVEKNAMAEAKREEARETLKKKEAEIQKQQEEKLNAAAGRRQEHLEKNVIEKAATSETRRQQILAKQEQEKGEKTSAIAEKLQLAGVRRAEYQASPRKAKSGALGGSPTKASPVKMSFKSSPTKAPKAAPTTSETATTATTTTTATTAATTTTAPTVPGVHVLGVRFNPIVAVFAAIVFSMILNMVY